MWSLCTTCFRRSHLTHATFEVTCVITELRLHCLQGVTIPAAGVHVTIAAVLYVLSAVTIRPHRSTTDAAYCYRLSSVVCRSVCRSVCHDRNPCKNGWTNCDAVWDVISDGPKEPCIRWGPDPHAKGQFWGRKGAGTCPDMSSGRYTQSDSVGGSTGTVQMPIGCTIWGAHWRHLANTIEPSVCVSDANIMSNYFDHLLNLVIVYGVNLLWHWLICSLMFVWTALGRKIWLLYGSPAQWHDTSWYIIPEMLAIRTTSKGN